MLLNLDLYEIHFSPAHECSGAATYHHAVHVDFRNGIYSLPAPKDRQSGQAAGDVSVGEGLYESPPRFSSRMARCARYGSGSAYSRQADYLQEHLLP